MRFLVLLLLLTLGGVAGMLFGAPRAHATLGAGSDSIARDGKALSAVARATTARGKYTVQEIVSDATTVREFVNPAGIVFAVAWSGLAHPDLSALLGSYHAEYKSARAQLPRKHGQKRSLVQGDRVVVETWGHMRNLQGRAYLPASLPAGVEIDEIR